MERRPQPASKCMICRADFRTYSKLMKHRCVPSKVDASSEPIQFFKLVCTPTATETRQDDARTEESVLPDGTATEAKKMIRPSDVKIQDDETWSDDESTQKYILPDANCIVGDEVLYALVPASIKEEPKDDYRGLDVPTSNENANSDAFYDELTSNAARVADASGQCVRRTYSTLSDGPQRGNDRDVLLQAAEYWTSASNFKSAGPFVIGFGSNGSEGSDKSRKAESAEQLLLNGTSRLVPVTVVNEMEQQDDWATVGADATSNVSSLFENEGNKTAPANGRMGPRTYARKPRVGPKVAAVVPQKIVTPSHGGLLPDENAGDSHDNGSAETSSPSSPINVSPFHSQRQPQNAAKGLLVDATATKQKQPTEAMEVLRKKQLVHEPGEDSSSFAQKPCIVSGETELERHLRLTREYQTRWMIQEKLAQINGCDSERKTTRRSCETLEDQENRRRLARARQAISQLNSKVSVQRSSSQSMCTELRQSRANSQETNHNTSSDISYDLVPVSIKEEPVDDYCRQNSVPVHGELASNTIQGADASAPRNHRTYSKEKSVSEGSQQSFKSIKIEPSEITDDLEMDMSDESAKVKLVKEIERRGGNVTVGADSSKSTSRFQDEQDGIATTKKTPVVDLDGHVESKRPDVMRYCKICCTIVSSEAHAKLHDDPKTTMKSFTKQQVHQSKGDASAPANKGTGFRTYSRKTPVVVAAVPPKTAASSQGPSRNEIAADSCDDGNSDPLGFKIFCLECGKAFRTHNGLNRHYGIKHPDVMHYCRRCRTMVSGEEHVKSHDGHKTIPTTQSVNKHKVHEFKWGSKPGENAKIFDDRSDTEENKRKTYRRKNGHERANAEETGSSSPRNVFPLRSQELPKDVPIEDAVVEVGAIKHKLTVEQNSDCETTPVLKRLNETPDGSSLRRKKNAERQAARRLQQSKHKKHQSNVGAGNKLACNIIVTFDEKTGAIVISNESLEESEGLQNLTPVRPQNIANEPSADLAAEEPEGILLREKNAAHLEHDDVDSQMQLYGIVPRHDEASVTEVLPSIPTDEFILPDASSPADQRQLPLNVNVKQELDNTQEPCCNRNKETSKDGRQTSTAPESNLKKLPPRQNLWEWVAELNMKNPNPATNIEENVNGIDAATDANNRCTLNNSRQDAESNQCCQFCGKNLEHLPRSVHERLRRKSLTCGKCYAVRLKASSGNSANRYGANPSFPCRVCGKRCGAERLCEAHVKLARPDSKATKCWCRYCGRCFARPGPLIMHERFHTRRKPFECEKCGKAHFTKYALDEHYAATHGAGEKFLCGACGKTFDTETRCKRHVQLNHQGTDIECETCGKAFRLHSSFRHHYCAPAEIERLAREQNANGVLESSKDNLA